MRRRKLMRKSSALFILSLIAVVILSGCSTFSIGSGSGQAIVSAPSGLTLRANQSPKAEKLDTVAFGETVEIISTGQSDTIDSIRDRWYRVKYNGETGYLFGGYLNLCNFSEADIPREVIRSWFTHVDPPYWEFVFKKDHSVQMISQKYGSKPVVESDGRYYFNKKALLKIVWKNNDVDYLLIARNERGAMTLYAPKTKFFFDPALAK
jgi:hypothetical protein